MFIIFARAILLYLIIVLVMRIMGKRQIGELQPYDLVLAILLAELAAVPMQDKDIPLANGLISILALMLAQVGLSVASLKSERARGIICGTPSTLISNGKIVEKELRRLRYNINDLLEQLRSKNCPNIADVEFAILETSGDLSVIPKSQKRPVTPEDLELDTKYEGLPYTLIIDGEIVEDNLRKTGLDRQWLQNELAKFGIYRIKDVFFASLDTQGNLFYQAKAGREPRPGI